MGLDKDFRRIKEEVRAEIMESLKMDKASREEVQSHISQEDFGSMAVADRIKLKNEYPKAYDRLIKR